MDPSSPSIVITGAGMVTPLGLTRHATWDAVLRGRCGCGPMSAMEQPLAPGRDGGQAPDLPGEPEPGTPREVRYLRHALRDALADAGFADGQLPYAPERCGLMIGTTLHGMRAGGQFLRTGDFEALRSFLASSTLRASAKELGVEGLAATTCSACSSSLGSVALAVTLLNSGQFDLILAGGYDPISEYVYGGFNSLRLVADGPLRPFTRGRQGMKLAEGYAVVVLERDGPAVRARGNKPLATVLGFGESADAHHLTQPHPQGDGAARAMADALRSAGLTPADIDLVAAHATGTPDNDAAEFAALSRTFADDLSRVPVVAFKSHLGHTLGGAGAVELILSAMALEAQTVPPCANVKREDLEFPALRLSTCEATPAKLRATLNTSLGFGGANTCVILGPAASLPLPPGEGRGEGVRQLQSARWPTSHLDGTQRHDVLVTGVGVVLPGAIGNDAFLARLGDRSTRAARDSGPIPESDIAALLNARRVRRMSDYVKLSLAATSLAFADAGVTDVAAFAETCAAVLGSTHGSANYSRDYYRQIVDAGIPAANPMLFAEGVPNAAAAHLSLMMSLKGACQTIIGSRTAGLDALRLAAERIAQGRWDRAVVSAGEEFCQTVNDGYRHCGLYAAGTEPGLPFAGRTGAGFAAGCGAVTLVLESRESVERRGGRVRGRVIAGASAAPREGREVDAAARVLHELGDPAAVLASANGTWVDRVEAAAVRTSAKRTGREVALSSLAGYFAETFSVTPLAGIAAVLLGRRMPMMLTGEASGPPPRDPSGSADGVAVLCTDYSGTVAGVCLGL